MINPDTSNTHPGTPANDEPIAAVRRVWTRYQALNDPNGPTTNENSAPTFADLLLVRELHDRLDEALRAPGALGSLTWFLTQEPELTVWKPRPSRSLSAADLLAHKPEPVPWLWEGLLPAEGLAMLSAAPKVGKSTLAYALAVAIAQGQPFLDYPTMKARVLIAALEESQTSVTRRLRRFGLQPEDDLRVIGPPFDVTEIRREVEEQGIRLVIIDTLARYWVGRVTDENNNAQVAEALAPLLALVLSHRPLCLLLIHHDRKSGGSPGQSVRGAGDLFAAQEQLFQLVEVPNADKNHRILNVTGRYQEESPSQVRLALDGDTYYRVDACGAEAAVVAVWNALPPEGGLTEKELETRGLSRRQIRDGVAGSGGRIVKTGEGGKADPYRYRRAGAPPGVAEDSVHVQP